MARPLRIQYPDAAYHVINRGRGRRDIYHGPRWYQTFLDCLDEAHERFGAQIHAYCLMTNHYHLLIKTPEGNLDRIMRHINGVYTQRYNKLSKTDGPLLRGRYKSLLIEQAMYWATLSRYVHRNPIEAATPLVKKLEDYPWSSYRGYIGLEGSPPWLYRTDTFRLCGEISQAQYKAFVEGSDSTDLQVKLNESKSSAPILGSDAFKQHVLRTYRSITPETPKWQSRAVRPTMEDVLNHVAAYYDRDPNSLVIAKQRNVNNRLPRWMAMYLCQTRGGHKVRVIGERFGYVSYGGVAKTLHQIRQQIKDNERLQHDVAKLTEMIQTKKTT